jgi:transcriptional regulator of acetoin/glycerol metabolism
LGAIFAFKNLKPFYKRMEERTLPGNYQNKIGMIPTRMCFGIIFLMNEFKTMIENERDQILAVLESCNWKISGKGGAAEILDVNVNTLNSRIKKPGIEKEIIARKKS